MPTPFEIGSLILAGLAVVGVILGEGRSRARNDVTAENVAKLHLLLHGPDGASGLIARIGRLEGAGGEMSRLLEKHFAEDMKALETINTTITTSVSELRADLRAWLGHEDTAPGRKP